MLRILASLTLMLLALAPVAAAAPSPQGTVNCSWDGRLEVEVCSVEVVSPPSDGATGPSGQTGASGISACRYQGVEIPCTAAASGGWWYPAFGCYVVGMSPPPPVSDPVWQGHTDGGVYSCVSGPAGESWPGGLFWLPAQPGGPGAPPDPAVVARRAVDSMQLRRIAIGMVPESGPDRVGIVGLPAWMWVADRSDQTFGPITRSASSGGVSVSATARVVRVVWEMGDGSSVTCTTPGTPFRAGDGGRRSPDCGYVYQRQGTYTVRATTYWQVAWSGAGQSGTIPLDMTSTTTVVIGELQAVTR